MRSYRPKSALNISRVAGGGGEELGKLLPRGCRGLASSVQRVAGSDPDVIV